MPLLHLPDSPRIDPRPHRCTNAVAELDQGAGGDGHRASKGPRSVGPKNQKQFYSISAIGSWIFGSWNLFFAALLPPRPAIKIRRINVAGVTRRGAEHHNDQLPPVAPAPRDEACASSRRRARLDTQVAV